MKFGMLCQRWWMGWEVAILSQIELFVSGINTNAHKLHKLGSKWMYVIVLLHPAAELQQLHRRKDEWVDFVWMHWQPTRDLRRTTDFMFLEMMEASNLISVCP